MLNLIADQSWNPFAPFGVTSWEPFVANLIAFILMVVILRYLAFQAHPERSGKKAPAH